MADSRKGVNIEQDMRSLVAETLETEPDQLDLPAKFVKDLSMDSMMVLEILVGIEKKDRIVIPEEMLPKFTDLGTTINLVTEILIQNKKLNSSSTLRCPCILNV